MILITWMLIWQDIYKKIHIFPFRLIKGTKQEYKLNSKTYYKTVFFFPVTPQSARDTLFLNFVTGTLWLFTGIFSKIVTGSFFPKNRKIFLFWNLSRALFVKGTFVKKCHGHFYRSHGYFFGKFHGQIKNCHGEKKNNAFWYLFCHFFIVSSVSGRLGALFE